MFMRVSGNVGCITDVRVNAFFCLVGLFSKNFVANVDLVFLKRALLSLLKGVNVKLDGKFLIRIAVFVHL
jgi:hypothetical protein